MKRIIFIFIFFIVHNFDAKSQESWIEFNNPQTHENEINLLQNNTQGVVFSVKIPGVFLTQETVNDINFTKLTLIEGKTKSTALHGEPDIQALQYRIAVPESDDFILSFDVKHRRTLSPCFLYPVPKTIIETNSDGFDVIKQEFFYDPNAYLIPRSNEPEAIISSFNYCRSQKTAEITFFPIEYCPVNQTLSVIEHIEISVKFLNPKGSLIKNTGFFSKVTSKMLINYENNQFDYSLYDKAFQHGKKGSVDWVRFQDSIDVVGIQADYIVVCADVFFPRTYPPTPPHNEVLRFCEHKSFYNGFDVKIFNIGDILDAGFYFEGLNEIPVNNTYKKEQQFRTFLRTIW